jgi:hypothetical protein
MVSSITHFFEIKIRVVFKLCQGRVAFWEGEWIDQFLLRLDRLKLSENHTLPKKPIRERVFNSGFKNR